MSKELIKQCNDCKELLNYSKDSKHNLNERKALILESMSFYPEIWKKLYCGLEGSIERILKHDGSINEVFIDTAIRDIGLMIKILERD